MSMEFLEQYDGPFYHFSRETFRGYGYGEGNGNHYIFDAFHEDVGKSMFNEFGKMRRFPHNLIYEL